jgi:hypothetical protein
MLVPKEQVEEANRKRESRARQCSNSGSEEGADEGLKDESPKLQLLNVRGSKGRGYETRKEESVPIIILGGYRTSKVPRSFAASTSPAGHSNAAGMCPIPCRLGAFAASFTRVRIARNRSAVLLLLLNYNRYLAIIDLTVPEYQPHEASVSATSQRLYKYIPCSQRHGRPDLWNYPLSPGSSRRLAIQAVAYQSRLNVITECREGPKPPK